MTVSELIEELKKIPGTLPVVYHDSEEGRVEVVQVTNCTFEDGYKKYVNLAVLN